MELNFKRPDLHMHSTASDGSDSPEELLQKVRAAGIDLFSLTDHDTLEGCRQIQFLLQPGDPVFIPGVEFSCEKNEGKFHILGYNFDPDHPALSKTLAFTHRERVTMLHERLVFLKGLGITFSPQELDGLYALKTPGKPHLAKLLLDNGFTHTLKEGYTILAGFHGREVLISPEEAIGTILTAGGIPVLAHGILGGGSLNLSREEITARVIPLKEAGLQGLECFYSTYTPAQERIMLDLADSLDLLVTSGSDYHGTNKLVALGTPPISDLSLLRPFYQGIFK